MPDTQRVADLARRLGRSPAARILLALVLVGAGALGTVGLRVAENEAETTAPVVAEQCRSGEAAKVEAIAPGACGTASKVEDQGAGLATAGPSGAQGAAGENGAEGQAGAAGRDGAVGPSGAAGRDGGIGVAGTNGRDGAVGPSGAAGRNGADGADGISVQGPPGETGARGPAGPAGADGQNGQPGRDGSPAETLTLSTPEGVTYTCPRSGGTDASPTYTCSAGAG